MPGKTFIPINSCILLKEDVQLTQKPPLGVAFLLVKLFASVMTFGLVTTAVAASLHLGPSG